MSEEFNQGLESCRLLLEDVRSLVGDVTVSEAIDLLTQAAGSLIVGQLLASAIKQRATQEPLKPGTRPFSTSARRTNGVIIP